MVSEQPMGEDTLPQSPKGGLRAVECCPQARNGNCGVSEPRFELAITRRTTGALMPGATGKTVVGGQKGLWISAAARMTGVGDNRGSDAWCDGKDRGGRTKWALDPRCGEDDGGGGQKGALDPRCGEDDGKGGKRGASGSPAATGKTRVGGKKGLWIPAAARMTGRGMMGGWAGANTPHGRWRQALAAAV